MNSYLVLILALLAGEYLLDSIAELLNLSTLKKTSSALPAEFQGVYDADRYRKSLRYLAETTRYGVFKSSVLLTVTVAFILAGGFEWIDRLARGVDRGSIVTGLIFAGALGALRWALLLPFSVYETFSIEQRYGFNQTTVKTFVTDIVKGAVLAVILGSLVFAALIYFFESVGPRAWLYAWIAFTAFQLLLQFVAPVLILPLFNRFSPLPKGDLKRAIDSYAAAQSFTLQGIFTMDSSKRTSKSNAFFTGFGRFRRLVLFDTLISKQSVDELVAVVAHEVGHFKRKHIPQFTALSILMSGLAFYSLSLFLNNPDLFAAFQMTHVSVYASIIFISFLYSPFLRFLSFFTQMLSRRFEFEADAYSVETYGKPEALISALKKLSVDNLSYLTPHWFKVLVDYTHPPVLKRIEVLRQTRSHR